MFYSSHVIDQLLDRIDLIDLARGYVEGLENRSGRWWGRCPFHSEKTPSFTLNPERKSYYCFGCQEKGNAIGLVMKLDHLSFPDALQKLAQQSGFPLPQQVETDTQAAARQADNKKREALLSLYSQVHKNFRQTLLGERGKLARDYIEQRGITAETARQFELGYATGDSKTALYQWLRRQNYSSELLSDSGLFSQRYREICLFWQRLIFPVFDLEGRVIAFSGRQLDPNAPAASPKYINSRESLVYRKGESLFGLFQSIKSLRQERSLILSEGNLDVLAWHQAGLGNAAAPLGTAFTVGQAKLLKRYCDKVILAFDGDEAGQKAIYKAAFLLEQQEISSQIIPLAPGRDPADILKCEGPDDLKSLARSPQDFFSFLSQNLEQRFALDELSGVSAALRFLAPFMAQVKEGLRRELYIAQLAKLFGLKQEVLAAEASWHYQPQPINSRYQSGGKLANADNSEDQGQLNQRGNNVGKADRPKGAGSQSSQRVRNGNLPRKVGAGLSNDLRAEFVEREFWASMLLQADLYPEWSETLSQDSWESEDAQLLKFVLDEANREQNFNFETLCDRVSRRCPELGKWILKKKLEPLQGGDVKDPEGYDMASYRQAILQLKYSGLKEFWFKQRHSKALEQIQSLEAEEAEAERSLELLREIQTMDDKLIALRETMQRLQKEIQRSSKSDNFANGGLILKNS